MISLAEARALLARTLVAGEPRRQPLSQARGLVLREEIIAPEDSPAFDRSAMDGYALAREDPATRFRVVAEIQPGPLPAGLHLQPGECARIFTGAPIPPGATAVVMQEETAREGEWMTPLHREGETHIRRRGEDMREGAVILPAGGRLGAAELSLLAFLGHCAPLVTPMVRVAHLATGNELVAPEAKPGPGEIRDSNSTLLAALLAEAGCHLVSQARCGDALPQLRSSVEAFPDWDCLLISGGASVGDYDFGRRLIEQLGFTVHFDRLNIRPGKPLIFATRGRQAAFVIPGNPVSHFVLYHLVIAAALELLQGGRPGWHPMLVNLASPIEGGPSPRDTYCPARVGVGITTLTAHPLRWQSSGDLTGLIGANALLHVPAHQAPPTGTVTCLLTGRPWQAEGEAATAVAALA